MFSKANIVDYKDISKAIDMKKVKGVNSCEDMYVRDEAKYEAIFEEVARTAFMKE